ncbi:MAG: glycosyltransferase family 2 protein [Bacteroidota bacterium]
MSLPKISIVTPSYNQGKYLSRTLTSVREQDYPDMEHFVIDGGSTDDTISILKKVKGLTGWVSESDNGQSHAINKGLAKTTGDILTWLNSDDQLVEGTLEPIARLFKENPELDLVYGNCLMLHESGAEKLSKPDADSQKLLGGMSFAQPASFFSRRILEKYGGSLRQDLHYGMDYDFFLFVALEGNVRYLDQTLAKYLFHPASKSTQFQARFAEDYAKTLQKLLLSVETGTVWLHKLTSAGFLPEKETEDRYQFSRKIKSEEIEYAVLENILSQIKFYYAGLELREARKRLEWLKAEAPDFFFADPQLPETLRRTRMLPAGLIRIYRKWKG